jgi:hypothetical protein
MNPTGVIGLLVIPTYVIIYLIPLVLGPRAVVLKGFTFFTPEYFLLGILFLTAMLNGAAIGKSRLGSPLSCQHETLRFNRFYLDLLALATIGAYLLWFRGVFFNPSAWLAVLKGGIGVNRLEHRTIGGVTTATQFGLAFVILYLTTAWSDPTRKLPARLRLYFYAILVLTFYRVFAWGERLALAEIMIPIFLLYVQFKANRERWLTRTGLKLLPFAGIAALFAYFGVTEYFRSWSTHYQFQDVPFWDFVALRLTTYYYTALNNGAGLLTVMDWPTWRMTYLLGWLHRFPLLIGASVSYVTDTKGYEYENFLERYADPEFNNPSGIFTPFLDVGIPGALFVAAVIGALAGVLYNAMREGKALGVVLYPIFFLQFIELFRYLYVGNQRAFPAIVALLLGCLFFRDRSARSPAARPAVSREFGTLDVSSRH